MMILSALLSLFMLQTPDSVLDRIGIDQRIGAVVDKQVSFHDEEGNAVTLGDLLGDKPTILTPIYFGCPMLCGMQLNGLVGALKVMPFTAGREFQIISFSFDPSETPTMARSKKERYLHDYGRPEAAAGWRFLTGNEAAIRKLTSDIGFRYAFDSTTDQWAHASTLVVLTPDGRIAQYFNGIEYDPNSLKYSLIEASENKLGSVLDRVVLYCYQYDPHSGKYSLTIMRLVRIAGTATVLGLAVFWAKFRKT